MEGEKVIRERVTNKKIRDIVKMSFPMKRVEHAVKSYRYSKMYTSSFTISPDEDTCSHRYVMNKIFAIRDLNTAEKRLAAKRIEARKMTTELDEKWTALQESEQALNSNFRKFNEFMKENQDKRERATRKIQEEIALQEERKDIVQNLKNRMEYYQKIQTMMIKKIREYRLYEDYLENVTKLSSNFKNVSAILIRFQALNEAKIFSGLKHDGEIVALEKARAQLAKLMEEKFTILLGLRGAFGDLNSRYETARINVLTWETTLQEVRQQILQEFLQSKSVMSVTKSLYKMMCMRQNIVPEKLEYEECLEFIKHTLTQLHWLRYVKFAGVKDTAEQPYESISPPKTVLKQSTEEEERQAVKELGKSRLSFFASLIHEINPKKKTKKVSLSRS